MLGWGSEGVRINKTGLWRGFRGLRAVVTVVAAHGPFSMAFVSDIDPFLF